MKITEQHLVVRARACGYSVKETVDFMRKAGWAQVHIDEYLEEMAETQEQEVTQVKCTEVKK